MRITPPATLRRLRRLFVVALGFGLLVASGGTGPIPAVAAVTPSPTVATSLPRVTFSPARPRQVAPPRPTAKPTPAATPAPPPAIVAIPGPAATLPLQTRLASGHVSAVFALLSVAGFTVVLLMLALQWILTRAGRRGWTL